MMTDDIAAWGLCLAAGVLFGGFFFGGLWWTIRRSLRSRNPGLWFAASFLLRTTLVLGAFYLVSGGDWRRLLACLLGFAVARPLSARLPKSAEAGHAS